jgi:class 3 adenylate cyclase
LLYRFLNLLYYVQLLVNKISDFNGDIQKFAGDALFAEFRASPTQPLHKCAELAAACASALVRECSDFPVETICSIMNTASDGIPSALNVHCGLSVGEMAGLHLGDNENRREYLYLGVPIKEAGTACDFAQLGEAAASRPFCELLQSTGAFRVDLSVDQEAFIIAERGNCRLSVNEAGILASQKRNARSRGITEHVDGLEPDSLIEYRRLMSLYVHPVQVMNDAAAANNFKPSSRASDQRKKDIQVEEAELRSVYVMFISPAAVVEMTGDAKRDSATVEYVQSIMTLTSRELRRYNGHLRQFIMDDKGLVMIATFGLRGSTVPNMVGERALPATVALFNAFEQEMGIECKIGSTFGDVYCGAVGGKKRHEYAVMGPSVNLAAR